jgi:hypothetical protein
MTDALLPAQFSDLEPFAKAWCLPTERERFAKRVSTSMDDLQAFYDAFFPRAEEAIAYCEKFPLEDMSDDAQRLLQLLYSLVMVSFPVEAWRQPTIPDSGAAYLDLVIEPIP